ncbi:MAG: tetratricopeptide repeat protein [Pseudomonadota bacterium]
MGCTRASVSGFGRTTGGRAPAALAAFLTVVLAGCSSLGGETPTKRDAVPLEFPAQKVTHTFDDPQVVIAWRRAEDARAVGNFALAFRHLRSALEIAPDDRALWSRLGEVALRLEQWDAAEKYAMRSNSLKPVPPLLSYRNWLIIVQAREQLRDYDGAEQAKLQARLFKPGF